MGRKKIEDLDPCPWCTDTPTIESWHGGGPNKTMVSCDTVGCHANPKVTGSTRSKAIERWNDRAT